MPWLKFPDNSKGLWGWWSQISVGSKVFHPCSWDLLIWILPIKSYVSEMGQMNSLQINVWMKCMVESTSKRRLMEIKNLSYLKDWGLFNQLETQTYSSIILLLNIVRMCPIMVWILECFFQSNFSYICLQEKSAFVYFKWQIFF